VITWTPSGGCRLSRYLRNGTNRRIKKGQDMRNLIHSTLALVAAFACPACIAAAPPAYAEDLIVKLVSVSSEKCLQPLGGSSARGVAIVQRTCDGSVAQQWLAPASVTTKVHLVNRASSLCLDARGKAVDGTPIQQWPCNTITNENWSYGITNNLLSSGISNTFSHCVATPGAGDGLPMELRSCTGGVEQQWNRPPG
jgi:ricin-type beta-trefoil lectin protein